MNDSATHAVAGGLGGMIAMSLTYPLVVLSTRSAVVSKKSGENLSTLQAVKKVLEEEGVEGLYAGLNSSLIGIAVTNTIFYFGLEQTRSILLGRRAASGGAASSSILETMAASSVAGAATTIATNPLWLVQTYQATRGSVDKNKSTSTDIESQGGKPKGKSLSTIAAAREIYAKDGLGGFWKGIGPSLVLVVNPVLQYTAFEQLAKVYGAVKARRVGGKAARLTDLDMFWLGALAKAFATSITYPYIVVKSRLHASTHQYKSSFKAVLSIMQEEGIAGLYGGITNKLVQSVLTAAFLFVAQRRMYELVKTLMQLMLTRQKRMALPK